MCFVSSITTSILCWQDCARTRTMYYCRTESPRPATWIPTVGSTALAVSRVTVVPKVKSAPWHQVRLAHVLKVQWNLLNLILCILACFSIYLNYLVPEQYFLYHFCLIVVLHFWILFCLQSTGGTIHPLLLVSVNYLPIPGCVWWWIKHTSCRYIIRKF